MRQNWGMRTPDGYRVAIVSRIFAPEPGAASFRLTALCRALQSAGAAVTVLTTDPPRGAFSLPDLGGAQVRRSPVLRDRAGYVRGYLQYMSFDVPAFFRLLFLRRVDVVVVEPPPTTGVVVGIAAWLRRKPYIYYAADVWSEAVRETNAPAFVAWTVRALERFAMARAAVVLAVSDDVARRVGELAPRARVATIGNGVDDAVFTWEGESQSIGGPYLLYIGTASEVHGAMVFVEAMPAVLAEHPDARLVFVGQGSDWELIAARGAELAPGAILQQSRVDPERAAEWIRGARATLASTVPGGYVAFPTKMLASAACGTPTVYAGGEPGATFAREPGVGWAVDHDPVAVADAMIAALARDAEPSHRRELSDWTHQNHTLRAVAERAVDALRGVVPCDAPSRAAQPPSAGREGDQDVRP